MLSADSVWLQKLLDISTSELPCFEKTSIQTGSRGEHFCYFPVNIVHKLQATTLNTSKTSNILYSTYKSICWILQQNSGKNWQTLWQYFFYGDVDIIHINENRNSVYRTESSTHLFITSHESLSDTQRSIILSFNVTTLLLGMGLDFADSFPISYKKSRNISNHSAAII